MNVQTERSHIAVDPTVNLTLLGSREYTTYEPSSHRVIDG
jgi:hypothetical protein